MLLFVIRRILLMIPTLVGILLVSFAIIQFVPGGPVEQLVQELRGASLAGEVSTSAAASARVSSPTCALIRRR